MVGQRRRVVANVAQSARVAHQLGWGGNFVRFSGFIYLVSVGGFVHFDGQACEICSLVCSCLGVFSGT